MPRLRRDLETSTAELALLSISADTVQWKWTNGSIQCSVCFCKCEVSLTFVDKSFFLDTSFNKLFNQKHSTAEYHFWVHCWAHMANSWELCLWAFINKREIPRITARGLVGRLGRRPRLLVLNKNASASFRSWAKSVVIATARRNQHGT